MHHREIEEMLVAAGFKAFRAKQVFHWVQKKSARSFSEMHNLPAPLLKWLEENTTLGGIFEVLAVNESADGSYKFLFALEDGRKVESVLMPNPKRNYWTQCLSSQVGCAVDCKFCVTGMNGFFRHMTADEITDQVLFVRRYLHERRPDAHFRNLVFMGMGEPLLNTAAVIKTIQILVAHAGIDLSPRRITVSTSGIIPGMEQLADADLGVGLALSLNAVSQEERERIMPITKKYPLADLLELLKHRRFGKNKRVTFEYVMLTGENDSMDHARRLVSLVKGLSCKINLIPFNPHPDLPYGRPDRGHVERFAQVLLDAALTVSVRWSKALDVDGACGQLAGDHRQRMGARGVDTVSRSKDAAKVAFPADLDFFATVAAEDDEEE